MQTLQAKAVLALAHENLDYYDQVLKVSRKRKQAGDIAQVDLDRLELQRVQYESDVQTGTVNLRTNKIQLLMLLNDRTPVEQFDVTGPFDFPERAPPLEELRAAALEARPDLKAAVNPSTRPRPTISLAVADGSTDPTFGIDFARNPPIPAYFGVSVTIPSASSIATRAKKPAPSSISRSRNACRRQHRHRCSTTSTPPMSP